RDATTVEVRLHRICILGLTADSVLALRREVAVRRRIVFRGERRAKLLADRQWLHVRTLERLIDGIDLPRVALFDERDSASECLVACDRRREIGRAVVDGEAKSSGRHTLHAAVLNLAIELVVQ